MAISMNAVLHDPVKACRQVAGSDGPFVIADAQVVHADTKRVIMHAWFRPITAFRREGFPREKVGIYIRSDKLILAAPHNAAGRSWLHCNQPIGDLCLWYTLDPRALQHSPAVSASWRPPLVVSTRESIRTNPLTRVPTYGVVMLGGFAVLARGFRPVGGCVGSRFGVRDAGSTPEWVLMGGDRSSLC